MLYLILGLIVGFMLMGIYKSSRKQKSLEQRLNKFESQHPEYFERARFISSQQWVNDGYSSGWEDVFSKDANGNLISSEVMNGMMHKPVFDVDQDIIEVVPSKTAGHFHLFINQPTSARHYRKMGNALAKAGVIDSEWWNMCKQRKLYLVEDHKK